MAGNPRKAKSAGSFRESMAKNYRYFIVGGLFLILVIVLVIFLATRGTDVVKEGEQNSAIEDIASSVEVPKDKYEQDAYPNVNTICTSYMNAMSIGDSDTMASLSNALSDERRAFFEAQAQYISQYADYHFYTKAGPEENSYLVLVTYTLQIVSDANKLPALCSLYVCTDESGTLYINNSDLSENDEAYILALASQDDFKQLQDDVQLAYNDMLEKNPDLSARVTELRGQINSDVQAKLEAKKQAETEAAAAQAAEEAAALAAANAKTVRATDVVNIRSSSSTDSEVLGKTSQGQEFTRYEVLENGWSKIDYNGQEAYIKTEYLEEVNQEAGAESSEVAANVREPGSTITVKENANIRSQPNTDSDSLGKASSGDTFTLVEEKDGWCKFTYDGKDAYIRSDLIQ
ncbi:MAG: SH3 domain-containing protein [Lachnospiraceae bacterium]|nr:SH3 domain-containing protein [Lachnospiraceae bacterium]MDO4510137.1 SH3 domain-containing protein [Lachnospiraceae bacterium]MDY4837539.1 SH3 domain-containing protein [Lachnospiraceae bacterium]MDY5216108.1 SH3 domain-containing protein [Lachnospiraceae bacterium]MDY5640286.1 SH3 domain-containing protein [Lachnospiraceae bacterium]